MNHLDRGLVGSVSLTGKVQSLVPGGKGSLELGWCSNRLASHKIPTYTSYQTSNKQPTPSLTKHKQQCTLRPEDLPVVVPTSG